MGITKYNFKGTVTIFSSGNPAPVVSSSEGGQR